MTLPGPLYTSANFRTHDSTPETLMPEGNKSRVSGGGVELNYTGNSSRLLRLVVTR